MVDYYCVTGVISLLQIVSNIDFTYSKLLSPEQHRIFFFYQMFPHSPSDELKNPLLTSSSSSSFVLTMCQLPLFLFQMGICSFEQPFIHFFQLTSLTAYLLRSAKYFNCLLYLPSQFIHFYLSIAFRTVHPWLLAVWTVYSSGLLWAISAIYPPLQQTNQLAC